MRYLSKTDNSAVLSSEWQYPRDARKIRQALLEEQQHYCAYSERYVQGTDSCDVEHFDPRLKGCKDDGYWNWYSVLHWVNSHKPRKIAPFLPILMPHDPTLSQRVKYEDGQFSPSEEEDREADNLIKFLGWNRPELARDRSNHVRRIRELRTFFDNDVSAFVDYLRDHPEDMSFATALEAELGIEMPVGD